LCFDFSLGLDFRLVYSIDMAEVAQRMSVGSARRASVPVDAGLSGEQDAADLGEYECISRVTLNILLFTRVLKWVLY